MFFVFILSFLFIKYINVIVCMNMLRIDIQTSFNNFYINGTYITATEQLIILLHKNSQLKGFKPAPLFPKDHIFRIESISHIVNANVLLPYRDTLRETSTIVP